MVLHNANTTNTSDNCVHGTSASKLLKLTINTTSVKHALLAAPESDTQRYTLLTLPTSA
jgi:hypothetical protein